MSRGNSKIYSAALYSYEPALPTLSERAVIREVEAAGGTLGRQKEWAIPAHASAAEALAA